MNLTKLNATTSLARMSIQFDIQGAAKKRVFSYIWKIIRQITCSGITFLPTGWWTYLFDIGIPPQSGNGRVGQPDCGRIPVLNRLVHHPVDKNEMPPHLWQECQYNLTYRVLQRTLFSILILLNKLAKIKCNAFLAGNGNIQHRIQGKKHAECTLFPTYFECKSLPFYKKYYR